MSNVLRILAFLSFFVGALAAFGSVPNLPLVITLAVSAVVSGVVFIWMAVMLETALDIRDTATMALRHVQASTPSPVEQAFGTKS